MSAADERAKALKAAIIDFDKALTLNRQKIGMQNDNSPSANYLGP